MTDREAMQNALEALENGKRVRNGEGGTKYQPDLEDAAIANLRERLREPEQERNFCARCGKRTNDIHTCTPPMENT